MIGEVDLLNALLEGAYGPKDAICPVTAPPGCRGYIAGGAGFSDKTTSGPEGSGRLAPARMQGG
jgi:hypothetical protein